MRREGALGLRPAASHAKFFNLIKPQSRAVARLIPMVPLKDAWEVCGGHEEGNNEPLDDTALVQGRTLQAQPTG